MTAGYNFKDISALIVDDYFPMHEIMRGILKKFGVGRIAELVGLQPSQRWNICALTSFYRLHDGRYERFGVHPGHSRG